MPSGLNSDGELAYNGLEKMGLYGNTQEALSQAVVEEYSPEYLASFGRGKPIFEAGLLTKAMSRKYYNFCGNDGSWSASCLNGFWGYIQYARNGTITRGSTEISDGIANAMLSLGTSFGGLYFDPSWAQGCDDGYCHWANVKTNPSTGIADLAVAVKEDSVQAPDGSYSWSQNTTRDSYHVITALFWYGGEDYFIVLNDGAYEYYLGKHPNWFWGG